MFLCEYRCRGLSMKRAKSFGSHVCRCSRGARAGSISAVPMVRKQPWQIESTLPSALKRWVNRRVSRSILTAFRAGEEEQSSTESRGCDLGETPGGAGQNLKHPFGRARTGTFLYTNVNFQNVENLPQYLWLICGS